MEKRVTAVLVAAGSSTRMGFDKLSFDLGGETVLHRSIRAFDQCPQIGEIVLVAGKIREFLEQQAAACQKPVQVVPGGATRAESAKNGVLAASGEIVAVHDAARPFVSEAVIEAALNAAAQQLYGRNYMDNTGVGDYLLKALGGNGIFDATYDKTVIANPEPAIFGGWQNTFSYKNWSLSMLMQFSQGGTAVYNDLLMEVTQPYAGKSVSRELYGNFWTPENTDARYARMGDGIYNYNSTLNDRYVFSTSYLRMKNITLAYELPRSVAQRLHLGSASVYAVATNLFTVTDWPGIDPESAGTGTTAGINYDSYPLSKTFSVGVKLSF